MEDNNEITQSICELIKNSFPHRASGEALVVSVYGEWGIGKTWHLQQIHRHFSVREGAPLERHLFTNPASKNLYLNIPVLFSPWKYERENHLIIPLLKTLEREIEKYRARLEALSQSEAADTQATRRKKALSTLKKVGTTIGDLSLALTAGLKFDFGLPGAKLSVSGGDMLKKAETQSRKNGEDPAPSTLDIHHLESLYYDSFESLEALADLGDSDLEIRLVVLIDDLDRCLPEKAVQMLESIKLFLNIRNFAFVLAVDDEVVERGINHRYRDYFLSRENGQNNDINPPITGAEYLEKIVHVPVHLPRWSREKIRGFLLRRYPDIFRLSPDNKSAERATASTTATKAEKASIAQPGDPERDDRQTNSPLLKLFEDALPPIPRKLIRAAEAVRLKKQVIQTLPGGHDFISRHDRDYAHLARITLLEQQYPPLFRLLRSHPTVYSWLFESEIRGNQDKDAKPDQYIADREGKSELVQGNSPLRWQWQQFETALCDSQRNRYACHPLAAFDGNKKSDSPLDSSTVLPAFNALYLKGQAYSLETGDRRGVTEDNDSTPVAEINIPQEALFATLRLLDTSSRGGFLTEQGLRGHHLPQDTFNAWVNDCLNLRENDSPAFVSLVSNIEWLEDMSDILSAPQLLEFYRKLDILSTIQASEHAPQTEPGNENER